MYVFLTRTGFKKAAPFFCAVFCLVNIQGVYGAAYSLETTMALNSEYRVRGNEGDSDNDLTEYNFFPSFALVRSQQDSELEASLGGHFRRYSNSNFDTNDFSIGLGYSKEFERSNYSINLFGRRDSTLIEQETTGEGGLNFGSARDIDTYGLSLAYSFRMTEKQNIRISAGAVERDYEEGDSFDSTSYNARATYSYLITPRVSWLLTLKANDFESDDTGVFLNSDELIVSTLMALPLLASPNFVLETIDGVFGACVQADFDEFVDPNEIISSFPFAVNVEPVACYVGLDSENNTEFYEALTGLNVLLSENLTLEVQAGVERVSQEIVRQYSSDFYQDIDVDVTRNNETYEASLSYKQETTNYQLRASRRSAARSSGTVESRDNIGFNIGHQLTARDAVSMRLGWFDETSSDNTISLFSRERYEASVEYTRSLSENWDAGIRYRYFEEHYENFAEQDQHAVLATLEWKPLPIEWRR